ncbi:hypothetical protein [Roseivirga pacifica]
MGKDFKKPRKVSAIVACALALIVTFTAGLNSYGETEMDSPLAVEFDAAVARAYTDVVKEEAFDFELDQPQVIKIYNAQDELVKTISLKENETIEDEQTQMLYNRAKFLTSYENTSIYRLLN